MSSENKDKVVELELEVSDLKKRLTVAEAQVEAVLNCLTAMTDEMGRAKLQAAAALTPSKPD